MRRLFLAVLVYFAVQATGFGQGCNCVIRFPQNTTATTIDGVIDTAAEWSGTLALDTDVSTDCLQALYDWTGGVPLTSNLLAKRIQVWAKSDGVNLFLAFRVKDQTQSKASGGSLDLGERIIVQFDPNASRGSQLGAGPGALQKDYRFEIRHRWNTSAGGALNFDLTRWSESTLPPASSACDLQDWQNAGALPPGGQVAGHSDGSGITGGYSVEFKVPLATIGRSNITSFGNALDIGISFGIVNDLGGPGSEATGVSFPASLPMNNAASPLTSSDLGVCMGWLSPDAWATGYFGPTAPNVEILRDPVWWSSASVEVFPCDTGLSTYTYDKIKACKLRVGARIENTGGTPVSRNLLFLWGEHGTGQVNWKYVDLQKNVNIPSGGKTVNSALWNDVPSGLAGHPCIRVYVLPTAFSPEFTEAQMAGITTQAQLDQLELVYQTGTRCMAQKNLSVVEAGSCTRCPSNAMDYTPSIFSLNAQETRPGVFLSDVERKRFEPGNVIVQLEVFGIAKQTTTVRPMYNFVEPVGGVIQMFPVTEALIRHPVLPVAFLLGNAGKVERRMFVKTTISAPPTVQNPKVYLTVAEGGIVLGPNEQRNITADQQAPGTGGGEWWRRWWWIVLGILVVLILIWLIRR